MPGTGTRMGNGATRRTRADILTECGTDGILRESFGYRLPHRGTTRTDSEQNEYSRMTDGDAALIGRAILT